MILILNIVIGIVLLAALWISFQAFRGKISWGQARVMGIPFTLFLWIQGMFLLVLGADAFAIVSYIIDLPIWIDILIFILLLLIIFGIFFKLLGRNTFKPGLFIPLVLVPLSIPGVGYLGKMTKTGAITLTETPIVKFAITKPIRKTTPAFRQGDNDSIKTIILLSAPGQVEAKLGRPAAGETGKTLQHVIKKLHMKDPKTFPSDKLDDYTIMNAVEQVHYKSGTGRTEGTVNEIIDSQNINRINGILKDYKSVVALGDKAQVAIKNSNFDGKVLSSNHPSKQSLNKQYLSDKTTPKDRNIDRISQWTDTIK